MRGDRVKITLGTMYDNQPDALVYVYGLEKDHTGAPLRSYDGSVQIKSLGGIKNGSTGVIMGASEKAHRVQLKDNSSLPGLGGKDFVEMIPVFLDYYQQLAYFPSDNVRILAGGR